MSQSPSIRPIVLLCVSMLTLLVGVFIGTRMGAGAAAQESTQRAAGTAQQRASASEALDAAVSAVDEREDELEGQSAYSESPEMAALSAFLQTSQQDPLRAAEEALASSNDLERISKLALLLDGASAEDMPGIADLLMGQRNDYERVQQMSMLYYAWGRTDAPAAVAYAEERGGRHSGMATSVALSSWASLDPASARAWVDGMENPERYQSGLLIGWSENSPLQALQYLSAQGSESDLMNRWVAPQMARNLVAQRGVMALDDLADLPSGRNRNELLERLADELGETQPEAAAARLTQIDDPEVLRRAVPELAQEWAERDPQAAVEFVNNYAGNTELYSQAMADVVEEWAERNPYDAGQFLNAQPASPELDRSVAEYSREVTDVDPAGAMDFAVSVMDDRLRADTIRRVARDWERQDAEGYKAWVEANPDFAPNSE